ncbi:type III polyketide synthase [Agriterribacter sp.]|uniref:type III polyketide synthase n=1 Tax=Agriterribacter sp. TaxID=2821509 RepID=UPI002CCB5D67|nr:type III polyketide synthase [Agriterribacter sp.]HRO44320.1 type III polyketide synthase [Agriterribacter sp.]HRQ16636.1 type III polyketide synthase [Agriterribacter sp.]
MSKIINIGTALPHYKHRQEDILHFMQQVYATDTVEQRKMKFLYHQSGIQNRYSVVGDYSRSVKDWKFYPRSESLEPFPSLEQRMTLYHAHAAPLSVDAIRNCTERILPAKEITHLITVSCTGMSAPGLDLQITDLMDLPNTLYRTSINFMGCYAAIHALKIADAICKNDTAARVMIVCTELCTLHFQKEATTDNITSSMLFADGSAAALIAHDQYPLPGLALQHFYAEIIPRGKKDMAWELSSSGFLMTLSGYIPELIKEDFEPLIARALQSAGITREQINGWCIHPGGKRILEAVKKCLHLDEEALADSSRILEEFGNMSSPTILFVLQQMMQKRQGKNKKILGAAFGPGLTMETFVGEMV